MEVKSEMRALDVEGRLSDLLRGIPNFSNVALDCIGLPIRDGKGDTIGKINNVDIGLDKWYGRVVIDSSICDAVHAVDMTFSLKGENK